MSEQAPERPPRQARGGALRSTVLGLPVWAWAVIGAAAVGAIVFIRLRSASKTASTATSQQVSGQQVPADQQIGLTEYEQISSQLTGIEGTNQALLAAIKDLQGTGDAGDSGGGDGGDGGGGPDKGDIKVPDVIGDQYPAAAAKITAAGLVPHRAEAYVGEVTVESPAAGTRVDRGAHVVLSGADTDRRRRPPRPKEPVNRPPRSYQPPMRRAA